MTDDFIDYGLLIDDAMHVIVKKALERVHKEGLPGKHHFFISFITSHPGVSISSALQNKYPEEMTIVLQHQFENLVVTDKGFSVVLSFDHVKEKIDVPFDALVAFADPSVKFGLQFRPWDEFEDTDPEDLDDDEFAVPGSEDAINKLGNDDKKSPDKPKGSKGKGKKTNVIDINSFRKK